MIYEYECTCGKRWDVWKPASEFDTSEPCECGRPGRRLITGGSGFMGAKVEDAMYDHAFGQVIKSSQQRREIAKARGMIEVGTESPETIHREMERTNREIRERRYDEALK